VLLELHHPAGRSDFGGSMQIGRASLFYGSVNAGKAIVCALALAGFASAAQADGINLGSMKDPLPDSITFKGVTVYGAIDMGYAYQTKGVPLSGVAGAPLNFVLAGTTPNRMPVSTVASNGLTQSFVGVKVEESIGMGWTVLGKAEIGFLPHSGELADGCASLVRQYGKDVYHQDSNGDSSRCGQTFNGPLYVGVSNAAYGTLRPRIAMQAVIRHRFFCLGLA
jgi:hypothetical protein